MVLRLASSSSPQRLLRWSSFSRLAKEFPAAPGKADRREFFQQFNAFLIPSVLGGNDLLLWANVSFRGLHRNAERVRFRGIHRTSRGATRRKTLAFDGLLRRHQSRIPICVCFGLHSLPGLHIVVAAKCNASQTSQNLCAYTRVLQD